MKIRLIVKIPRTTQTGPYDWQDTTEHKTIDLECPPALLAWYENDGRVVGAHILEENEAQAKGGDGGE